MTSDTRTAILIAAYNAEATLERAVMSALAQPEAAEVCIVDDASFDATLARGQALAARDGRVKVLSLPANAGPSAARNAAIAATVSPWLAVLDADDYLLDGRLAALHARAEKADFIADALIRTTTGVAPDWAGGELTTAPLDFRAFVLGNLGGAGALDLGYMKPLMRRAFLDEHSVHYAPAMRLGEDYELYARALALGARFLVCGAAGYVSVERAGSLSKDHDEADLRRLRDCDDAIAALRPLSSSEARALDRHWTSVNRRLQWRRLISAVKARNAGMALSTFTSLDATIYLLGKLAEQLWLRGTGRGPTRTRLSTSAAH